MSLKSSLMASLLTLPAAGYSAVQTVRRRAYARGILKGRQASVPVISVGNLLMGGSGKTPFVIYLAEMLRTHGFKPCVVSRGYKGTYRAPYLVVGDGMSRAALVDPSLSGDEPFLIASRLPRVPVIVGRRRIDAVNAAEQEFRCDSIVLDDGFQHLQLNRDVDLVLITGQEDRMFPAGLLREPACALRDADVLVLVGKDAKIPSSAEPYLGAQPIFRCRPVPLSIETSYGPANAETYAGREVILASGIANPARFRNLAEELGWRVIDHLAFPDHYRLSEDELASALSRAGRTPVIVTEKDWVKLPASVRESGRISALRIGINVDDEEAFWRMIESSVSREHV